MAPVTPFPHPGTRAETYSAETYKVGGHKVSYELLATLK